MLKQVDLNDSLLTLYRADIGMHIGPISATSEVDIQLMFVQYTAELPICSLSYHIDPLLNSNQSS